MFLFSFVPNMVTFVGIVARSDDFLLIKTSVTASCNLTEWATAHEVNVKYEHRNVSPVLLNESNVGRFN
jgi:hypothetical protein